jgi:hypothetical protein
MSSEESNMEAAEQLPLFPDLVSEYREGKDELNLAEFPIAALSNRVGQDIKTIVFEDDTFDRSTGKLVKRSLTITASDAYGLPTAADDEILLGLVQLSRQQGFISPRVYFTVYQLLRIIGWQTSTKNYRRVNDALNRWLGVSLYYDNAWRDKATNQWVNQKFHFLDNVEIYKQGSATTSGKEGISSVKWNEMVFRSFQSGNLKALDFQVFRQLDTAIAKRMFRFLDKRFYMRTRLSFELERFAFDKMGLPRGYADSAQIKRRLMPGIEELEAAGFIKAVPASERFSKARSGDWEVHFEKKQSETEVEQPKLNLDVEDLSPTEGRLVGHGVTRAQARRMVSEFDDERIVAQLEALEYLLIRDDGRAPDNRAGWLVAAIQGNYAMPKGFKSQEQKEAEARSKEAKARQRKLSQERKTAQQNAEEQAMREEDEKVAAYLATLSALEMAALEADALALYGVAGRKTELVRRQAVARLVRDRLGLRR